MSLPEMLTDELCAIREEAHAEKNYLLSDQIRNELDSRGSFAMDTPDGQTVYHMGDGWTRKRLLKEIKWINEEFNFNERKQRKNERFKRTGQTGQRNA